VGSNSRTEGKTSGEKTLSELKKEEPEKGIKEYRA